MHQIDFDALNLQTNQLFQKIKDCFGEKDPVKWYKTLKMPFYIIKDRLDKILLPLNDILEKPEAGIADFLSLILRAKSKKMGYMHYFIMKQGQ